MQAQLIKTNGEETDIEPEDGKFFGLEELQRYVGGYIEVHTLDDGRLIVINEDGLLMGLPQNPLATVAAHNLFTTGRGVVGDVVICNSDQMER